MTDAPQEQEPQDGVTFSAAFHPMPEAEVFVNGRGGISIKQDTGSGYDKLIAFPGQVASQIAKAILGAAEAAQRI